MSRGRIVGVVGCCVIAAALQFVAGIWTIPPAILVLGLGVWLVAHSSLRSDVKFASSLAVVLATFALLVGFFLLTTLASND